MRPRGLIALAFALGCSPAVETRRPEPAPRPEKPSPAPAPAPDPDAVMVVRGRATAQAPAAATAPQKLSVDLDSLRPDDPITLVPRSGPTIDATFVSIDTARINVTLVKGSAPIRGATFGLSSLCDVRHGWSGSSADDPRAPLVAERWATFDVRAIESAPEGAAVELLPFGREAASDDVAMNGRGAAGFHRTFGLGAKPAIRLVVPGEVVIGGKLGRSFSPASEARELEVKPGDVDVAFDSGARVRVALAPVDVERDSGPDATPEGATVLPANAWGQGTVQLDGDRTDCWALVLDAPVRVALYVHGRGLEVVLLPGNAAPDTKTPWELPAGRHVVRVRAAQLGPQLPYALYAATGATTTDLELARLALAFDDSCSPVRRLDATQVKEILSSTTPGDARLAFARARLDDQRPPARRLACQALALWKDRDSAERLNRIGVLDPDANVRLAARTASEELARWTKRRK
jgi:hypothetical protein